MNSIFLQIIIFLIVLFVYVHLMSQLKTNNSLEIYDAGTPTTIQLADLCNIRQPCVFYFDTTRTTNAVNNLGMSGTDTLTMYVHDDKGGSPLQIKSDYSDISQITQANPSHFSCYNSNLITNNVELDTALKSQDNFLKPVGNVHTNHDLIIGGNNGTTPFKYDINNRTFLTAYTTSVRVQLAPPSSINELSPHYDYDLFEFKSDLNPWSSDTKHTTIKSKISTHVIEVHPGQTLFIPPYWWYSIQFSKSLSHIGYFGYHTAVSALSVSSYLIMRCFQMQNTRHLPHYKNMVNEEQSSLDSSTPTNESVQETQSDNNNNNK
jgi:hypothetical protein